MSGNKVISLRGHNVANCEKLNREQSVKKLKILARIRKNNYNNLTRRVLRKIKNVIIKKCGLINIYIYIYLEFGFMSISNSY